MGNRCATRSYLQLVGADRPWTGTPSVTQLIQGTMQAFLKIKHEYSVSPDARAFMIHGTKAHKNLEASDDEYSLLEEKFVNEDITGIGDAYEQENGVGVLTDYKISGSYKVAQALGMVTIDEPTGEFFKSGPRKGMEKTRKILTRDPSKIDIWDWKLQLNRYRIEFEKRGFPVHKMKVQATVRDGNTYIARGRGVIRNIYYFEIERMPDEEVLAYFEKKRNNLLKALKQGYWKEVCTAKENWDGLKCEKYCEVAEFCSLGKYLKKEKESDEMAIKNLSEIRRLPRLGKIRLGVKKKNPAGKEYPTEVDYFILDPSTPIPEERERLLAEWERLFGKNPKQIRVMFPVSDLEVLFPQFYKRYGSGTMLQCKGDGATATCASEEFAKGLTVIETNEMKQPVVKCLGRECVYYKDKKCSEVATLNVLIPELPGAGVWQITTGSYNSIVGINSGLEYIRGLCGRFNMVPLTLERRKQDVTEPGGKRRAHFIMQINLDFKLADLQKFAQIDSTKILMELPEPSIDAEEIAPALPGPENDEPPPPTDEDIPV